MVKKHQPIESEAEAQNRDRDEAVEPVDEQSAGEVAPEAELEAEPREESEPAGRAGSRWRRLRYWLFKTKAGRLALVAAGGLVLGGVAVAATDLRYPVVGLLYHNRTEVKVVDSLTGQPLPGAEVKLGGQVTATNKEGVAVLRELQLGRSTLTVTKKAYKTAEQPVLVPIGKLSLTPVKLESTGIALSFKLTDKVSGQPVDGAEVTAGDVKAVSEKGEGRIVLLPNSSQTLTAKVTKDGYLDGELKLDLKKTAQPYELSLVPKGKVYYLSNRSGRLDLYASNLDGSGAEMVLAGTGKETAETGLLPNVDKANVLALVSSREGRRNSFGNVQTDLFLFYTDTHRLQKIDDSVYFYNYRAWAGDTLVYEKETDGCKSIKTYQASSQKAGRIFACSGGNQGSVNVVYDESVLYSVTNADSNLQGLYLAKVDGGNNRRINPEPAHSLSRQVKDTLQAVYYNNVTNQQVWSSIDIETFKITKLDNGPAQQTYRSYVDSPGEKWACFVDERDGKSELYLTDHDGKNERKLTSLGSVNQFVQWISDKYIVFSSTKSDENALYVVAADGGQPVRITDFYRGNSRAYSGGYNPAYGG